MSVCLNSHSMLPKGVPVGIKGCLTRECLQVSAGVNGLTDEEGQGDTSSLDP